MQHQAFTHRLMLSFANGGWVTDPSWVILSLHLDFHFFKCKSDFFRRKISGYNFRGEQLLKSVALPQYFDA